MVLSVFGAFAQNVGINSTGAAPVSSAALDVDMANKGVLIPRVALTTTAAFAPVTGTATASLLVYNTATAGVSPNNVTPGFYYWDGAQWVRVATGSATNWIVGGNTLAATGILGTLSNNHVDFYTNNIVRGRLSNLGEFFIGATNTVLAGDLMNGVGNNTFPWAINGYTDFNGSGVYGSVTSGTTIFGGLQGEYYGTNASATGTRGIYGSTTAGTGFNAAPSGVQGTATTSGSYKFGVYGSGGTSARSGGVFGYDYGIAQGSLGYYANSAVDYGVYGFGQAYQAGAAGGKGSQKSVSMVGMDQTNNMIGLGIYGGMMGGWIRGMAYGTHVRGEIYSMYVDGKTYTNAPITQLIETTGDRQPVYAATAMKAEVSSRGKNNLQNGQAYVTFSDDFKNTISTNPDELTITVSPMGNSNGIYIVSYDQNGFTVAENNSGSSNVAFTWIAIGTQSGYEAMSHDAQILAPDFDQKMNGVMYNDMNESGTPQTMWWDGTQMRFDAPVPEKSTIPGYKPTQDASRPKTAPAPIQQSVQEVE